MCKAGRFKINDVEYRFEFELFPSTTDALSNANFTPQGEDNTCVTMVLVSCCVLYRCDIHCIIRGVASDD